MSTRNSEQPKPADQAKHENPTAPTERKIQINVDAELTLDARVARLEELEVLRVAAYQAGEMEEQFTAITPKEERFKWRTARERAQRKIGEILNQIHASVQRRFDAQDPKRSSKL